MWVLGLLPVELGHDGRIQNGHCVALAQARKTVVMGVARHAACDRLSAGQRNRHGTGQSVATDPRDMAPALKIFNQHN
jgi:hypothetical protein